MAHYPRESPKSVKKKKKKGSKLQRENMRLGIHVHVNEYIIIKEF